MRRQSTAPQIGDPGGSGGGIALSFDDGPDPVWTPKLLDVLDQCGVSATFFPIARRATHAPGVVTRIRDAGHTIGVHCDEHVRHSQRDRAWVERDTDRALSRLAALGVEPSLWRTPWGERAPFTREIAERRDLTLVHWTVDTHDWRGDSADEMFAATRDLLRPGAIVLAHDGIGPGARRTDAGETLEFVRRVVAHADRIGCPLNRLS